MDELNEYLGENGEHEILHLKGRISRQGKIIDGELSYMSDHQIFLKYSVDGMTDGWMRYGLWEKIEEVYAKAAKYAKDGWEASWHPAYEKHLNDFMKSARF